MVNIPIGNGLIKRYGYYPHCGHAGDQDIPCMVCAEHSGPYLCPVCQGRGFVVLDFYESIPLRTDAMVPCRSCVNGLVWKPV